MEKRNNGGEKERLDFLLTSVQWEQSNAFEISLHFTCLFSPGREWGRVRCIRLKRFLWNTSSKGHSHKEIKTSFACELTQHYKKCHSVGIIKVSWNSAVNRKGHKVGGLRIAALRRWKVLMEIQNRKKMQKIKFLIPLIWAEHTWNRTWRHLQHSAFLDISS